MPNTSVSMWIWPKHVYVIANAVAIESKIDTMDKTSGSGFLNTISSKIIMPSSVTVEIIEISLLADVELL